MTGSVGTLERLLTADLERLGDRLADDRLCRDLYRAMSNRALYKLTPRAEGHIVLSWGRAEEVINSVWATQAQPPLSGLAQSGAEGEVSERAGAALAELGWEIDRADSGRDDDRHVSRPASPPPAAQGERSPAQDSRAWERRAHEEADQRRRRP